MSPAETEAMKKMMCVALAMKRGDMKMTTNTPAGKAAESMTEEQLTDMCGSPSKEATKKGK